MELDNLERHELAAEFVSNPKSLIKAFQQWIDRFESLDSRQSAAVGECWQSFERIADAMDFARTKSSLVADFANRTERVRFLMTKFFRDFPFVPETAADTWQDLLRSDVEHFRQNLLFNESVPVAGVLLAELSKPDVTIQMLRDHAGCSRQPVMSAMKGETLTKERLGQADWYVYAELLPILKAKSNTARFRWPPSVAGLKTTAKNT